MFFLANCGLIAITGQSQSSYFFGIWLYHTTRWYFKNIPLGGPILVGIPLDDWDTPMKRIIRNSKAFKAKD